MESTEAKILEVALQNLDLLVELSSVKEKEEEIWKLLEGIVPIVQLIGFLVLLFEIWKRRDEHEV